MRRLLDTNFARFLKWRLKKSCESSSFLKLIIIIGLCFGLIIIGFFNGLFYNEIENIYYKGGYAHYPVELNCAKVSIIDGDSVVVDCPDEVDVTKEKLHMIRIWGIDAPETEQDNWGNFSTETLKKIIGPVENLSIKIMQQDRYQRYVAKIYIEELDVGLEMVKRGAAIVYHRYNDDSIYSKEEEKAKIRKVGIWEASGAHQNPEKWRRFNPQ